MRFDRLVLAAVLVLGVLPAAGCGVIPTELSASEQTTFWEPFQFGESMEEVSSFSTIRELRDASDAVVTARVSGVRTSRVVQGDAAQDQVAMICVDIRVEAVIAGSPPDDLCLEFLGGTPGHAEGIVQRSMAVGLPRLPAIFFVHAKRGSGEEGLYRVTNSTGLWAATSRALLDTPLRPETPAESGLYGGELGGVDTVADLAELLRRT